MPVDACSAPRKEENEYVMSLLKPWDRNAFKSREEMPVEFESWFIVGMPGMRSVDKRCEATMFFCIVKKSIVNKVIHFRRK